jgi:hypothetical protein
MLTSSVKLLSHARAVVETINVGRLDRLNLDGTLKLPVPGQVPWWLPLGGGSRSKAKRNHRSGKEDAFRAALRSVGFWRSIGHRIPVWTVTQSAPKRLQILRCWCDGVVPLRVQRSPWSWTAARWSSVARSRRGICARRVDRRGSATSRGPRARRVRRGDAVRTRLERVPQRGWSRRRQGAA